jgi:hypothetical protein
MYALVGYQNGAFKIAPNLTIPIDKLRTNLSNNKI